MYLTQPFSATVEAAIQIMNRFPFATIVTTDQFGDPLINHVPLLTEVRNDKVTLIGHFSKRNPQWRQMKAMGKATAVFHGPHSYISPKWYISGRDVPTWNYVAVQVTGPTQMIEDFEGLKSILIQLSDRFEKNRPDPWTFELPTDLMKPQVLENAIVGFEIEAEKIEAKFKLGQTRPLDDQKSVMKKLEMQSGDMERAMLEVMKEAGLGTTLKT